MVFLILQDKDEATNYYKVTNHYLITISSGMRIAAEWSIDAYKISCLIQYISFYLSKA